MEEFPFYFISNRISIYSIAVNIFPISMLTFYVDEICDSAQLAGTGEYADCTSAEQYNNLTTRAPFGSEWWPVMLEDRILVAEQSLT